MSSSTPLGMKDNDEDKTGQKQHPHGADDGNKTFFHGNRSTAGATSRIRPDMLDPVNRFSAGL